MSATTSRFITDDCLQVPGITARQMQELDRIAINETGPNLFQMMENAGRNLALQALEVLGPSWRNSQILILAGSGGNGGGGICAGRHLANRGIFVDFCLVNQEKVTSVTAWQIQVLRTAGGREVRPDQLDKGSYDLMLDALIGYSLSGPPRGLIRELVQWSNSVEFPIVSLDVPSGMNPDNGEIAGLAVNPHWTLTLALPKTGLAAGRTGELILADIGIPTSAFRKLGLDYQSPFGSRFRVRIRPCL